MPTVLQVVFRRDKVLTMVPTRDDAWTLLNEYTAGESLLKHALAVETAVRGYAGLFGEDKAIIGGLGKIDNQSVMLTTVEFYENLGWRIRCLRVMN